MRMSSTPTCSHSSGLDDISHPLSPIVDISGVYRGGLGFRRRDEGTNKKLKPSSKNHRARAVCAPSLLLRLLRGRFPGPNDTVVYWFQAISRVVAGHIKDRERGIEIWVLRGYPHAIDDVLNWQISSPDHRQGSFLNYAGNGVIKVSPPIKDHSFELIGRRSNTMGRSADLVKYGESCIGREFGCPLDEILPAEFVIVREASINRVDECLFHRTQLHFSNMRLADALLINADDSAMAAARRRD